MPRLVSREVLKKIFEEEKRHDNTGTHFDFEHSALTNDDLEKKLPKTDISSEITTGLHQMGTDTQLNATNAAVPMSKDETGAVRYGNTNQPHIRVNNPTPRDRTRSQSRDTSRDCDVRREQSESRERPEANPFKWRQSRNIQRPGPYNRPPQNDNQRDRSPNGNKDHRRSQSYQPQDRSHFQNNHFRNQSQGPPRKSNTNNTFQPKQQFQGQPLPPNNRFQPRFNPTNFYRQINPYPNFERVYRPPWFNVNQSGIPTNIQNNQNQQYPNQTQNNQQFGSTRNWQNNWNSNQRNRDFQNWTQARQQNYQNQQRTNNFHPRQNKFQQNVSFDNSFSQSIEFKQ